MFDKVLIQLTLTWPHISWPQVLYDIVKFHILSLLLLNLRLNGIDRIAHFMRDSSINKREEPFFSDSHLIKYFLRYVNHLNNFMLVELSFDLLSSYLNILQLLLVFVFNGWHHLIDIVLYIFWIALKQIF